jgi:hypothetical protein
MTSDFKKIIIVVAVVFILALSFWMGVVFFAKNNGTTKTADNQQEKEQINDYNKKLEITEEEKVKTFAENFAMIYYSYTWGNFSNIESQYYYMTDEMKNREKDKVERIKKGTENQSQKYFTVRAKLVDSAFIFYGETKTVLEINLNIDNYAGAIVQRDTMVWVNESGDYYEGDLSDLVISTTEKKINIELIKISDEWKIDEIREIKY